MSSIDTKTIIFKDRQLDITGNGVVGKLDYPIDTKFIYHMIIRVNNGLYEVLDSFARAEGSEVVETVYVKRIHTSDI